MAKLTYSSIFSFSICCLLLLCGISPIYGSCTESQDSGRKGDASASAGASSSDRGMPRDQRHSKVKVPVGEFPDYDKNRIIGGVMSSWSRFIMVIVANGKSTADLKTALDLRAREYLADTEVEIMTCRDRSSTEKVPGDYYEVQSGVPIHIPVETKPPAMLSNIVVPKGQDPEIFLGLSNLPRVRNHKKALNLLTSEPYQRVMSFAIEQCMIPSMWYLEVIHCMFTGMASRFNGVIFSYSLQDVVGAALMSLGYKDEVFNLENCFNAVSLVVDDQISPHYTEICNKVNSCLESRPFEGKFSKLKAEFQDRISDTYSRIPLITGVLAPMQLFRYSVLFSMSLLKSKGINLKLFPERNFLPVRIALATVAYYAVSQTLYWQFESEKNVTLFFTKLITRMLFEISTNYIGICKEDLSLFSKKCYIGADLVFEQFCKEIFSAGFIVEAWEDADFDEKLFSRAVMPVRVLDPAYSSFIPSLLKESGNLSSYDWVKAETEVREFEILPVPMKVQKEYKSKKLTRTLKRDHFGDGVRPSLGEEGLGIGVRGGRKAKRSLRFLTKKNRTKRS
ncbi:putative Secreted Protein [Cryptosporidium felis]|nr:putative Secreted Protein [Cryptosporidium felis]